MKALFPSTGINPFQQEEIMRNAYKLSCKFGHDKCEFCWNKFDQDQSMQSLLICGHRYHRKCLLKWEIHKYSRCALCRTGYNRHSKWNYDDCLKISQIENTTGSALGSNSLG